MLLDQGLDTERMASCVAYDDAMRQAIRLRHPAADHLTGAELSLRCIRRAYADGDCRQAATFCRSAIEDLRAALASLEARQ
jgi:hypothetical protein